MGNGVRGGGTVGGGGGNDRGIGRDIYNKEEERGREHKMTNTTFNPNILYSYLYLYTCLHYTKQENIH